MGPQLPLVLGNIGRVMCESSLALHQLTRPRGVITGELLRLS